jgi:adenylate kinase family enzyme
MYEINARTLEVLSLALHDLAKAGGDGTNALQELARLIRLHGGIAQPARANIKLEIPAVRVLTDSVEAQLSSRIVEKALSQVPSAITEESAPVATEPGIHMNEVVAHPVTPEEVHASEPTLPEMVFVIGGPGSGKGTLCDKLIANHGYKHLSIGEAFRAEIAAGSDIGHQVDELIKAGALVPDDVVMQTLTNTVMGIRNEPHTRLLLDGFPRTVEQAIMFEMLIGRPSKVIWLNCDDTVLVNRILGRAATSGRADDHEEAVLIRIKTFKESTAPIYQYMEAQFPDRLVAVDASGSIDDVYVSIKLALTL